MQAYPDTTFIFTNALGVQPATFAGANRPGAGASSPTSPACPPCYHDDMGQLLAEAGAGSVVLGTGIPFNYAQPAFLKVEALDATEAEKEQIRSGNMRAILGL